MVALPFGSGDYRSRDLLHELIKVNSKLDIILMQQRELKADQDDHEARLRKIESGSQQEELNHRVHALERWRWSFPSIALVLSAVAVAVSVAQFVSS